MSTTLRTVLAGSWLITTCWLLGGCPAEDSEQNGDGDDEDATEACPGEGFPTVGCDADNVGLECSSGEECCCGDCFPSLVCTCNIEGWSCYATDACLLGPDACPDAGVDASFDTAADLPTDAPADVITDAPGDTPNSPECPAEPPIGQTGCTELLQCEYGQECCCGDCFPSTVCNCNSNAWTCFATDACMLPPDACAEVPDAGPDAPACAYVPIGEGCEQGFVECEQGGPSISCIEESMYDLCCCPECT